MAGGVFCRIARADSGLRSPHRLRFSTTNSRPFTGSAPERNTVRPGLLAKTVPVRDPCRSSISNIACASRSRSGFTVRRTARKFSESTRPPAANPPATRAAPRPQAIRFRPVLLVRASSPRRQAHIRSRLHRARPVTVTVETSKVIAHGNTHRQILGCRQANNRLVGTSARLA